MKKFNYLAILLLAFTLVSCECNEPDKVYVFSVGGNKTVVFSLGNLQYHPKNDQWRFARKQTDYIGDLKEELTSDYNGWIDLFGWSTDNRVKFGVSASVDLYDYQGMFIDWGVNNIERTSPKMWRTLTGDEWYYLLKERENCVDFCGIAQVDGVNGLIVLPDNWSYPSNVTFKGGFDEDWDATYNYANYQKITKKEWAVLEQFGAIFLPAAGFRLRSKALDVQNYGHYWASTDYNAECAHTFYFFSGDANVSFGELCTGCSVRLVQDL